MVEGMSEDVFTKHAPPTCPGQPFYEAAGLKWLGEGGAKVPAVVEVTGSELQTVRLTPSSSSPAAARELGRMLAHLHASGAPNFGAPPPDYFGPGYMGLAPLPLITPRSRAAHENWGAFYAKERVLPYLDDTFTPSERQIILELADALESGELDHPQPALVRENGFSAARIHGDLWSGNVMWTGGGAYLIDPAAQGGHAEEDFGALSTFGVPHFAEIVEGYQQVSPFAAGWEKRLPLHRMHILMVHCYLFGRSYVPRTLIDARAALEVSK